MAVWFSYTAHVTSACFELLLHDDGLFLFLFQYIVIDTQLMLGGKHQYEINEEEYVFAALNLYLDIINLFLFLLRIVNKASN